MATELSVVAIFGAKRVKHPPNLGANIFTMYFTSVAILATENATTYLPSRYRDGICDKI